MDQQSDFWRHIREDMTVTLATAAEDRVTMRLVSPVAYAGGVLIFTSAASVKYRQLRENPQACLAAGPYFAEVTAAFHGPCMAAENAPLRAAYSAKFADAFAEGVSFGGRESDFILLRPTRLSGWLADGSAPFDLAL